ncbi:MAG: hypothetical protein COT74_02205 [Bdellovibrionales bacterium CG10_big_fil_rev_8_21_14_0_10_45_34]|nr:MAG: hypothetical protein COT74_02205 [Bdellovibrionales bacterium CG10_big_fil_rev_8_21_14_0_10_45_34]
MKHWFLFFFLNLFFLQVFGADKTFRFHLFEEPATLDPIALDGIELNYVISNLFRGLYRYDERGRLRPEGAKRCQWKNSQILECHLNPQFKWSDGTRVVADDYVRSFTRIIDPAIASVHARLLMTLKNAKKIQTGQRKPNELGIKAITSEILRFELEVPDSDLEYKLAASALVPLPPDVPTKDHPSAPSKFCGPYVLSQWQRGKSMMLEPNIHYFGGNPKRPKLEIFFVSEDSAALHLFETGRISFLRRLPAALIPAYKTKKEFFLTPLSRFDYIGFSPSIKSKDLKFALSRAADFEEFKRAFSASGRPGCPGFPESFVDKWPCIDFDPKLAKTKMSGEQKKLTFALSAQGGDDLRRVAEWYQGQWKKHLGIETEIQLLEPGVYRNSLETRPADVFRYGFSLDRPTCLAAIEGFTRGHKDNFVKFDDVDFEKLIVNLQKEKRQSERKILCRKGVELLINRAGIIPQGRIHFAMLRSAEFEGWHINELNQMDLSQLHPVDSQVSGPTSDKN